MTSARKIKANRSNAKASTGPKTVLGKARAAQNALRHGLSLSVGADPSCSEDINSLAREVAGEDATDEMTKIARCFVEAQIDLIRIRQARRDLLARKFSDPDYRQFEVAIHNTKVIRKIVRRIGILTPIPPVLMNLLQSPPEGPHKILAILSDLAEQLIVMDRYERRTLSRRKFAIRALDAVRRQATA